MGSVERVFNPDRKETHLGHAQAEERPMTVFVYVNTSKQVGNPRAHQGVRHKLLLSNYN
jgi:hypothetical protein